MCVCVRVCIHLYTHVHVIVPYNVCGIIDTLLLLLTVMYWKSVRVTGMGLPRTEWIGGGGGVLLSVSSNS